MSGVAIVGAGGLGAPAALCLARAGVPFSIFDGDRVEPHNLPRQLLYRDGDVGRPKAQAAAGRLRELVPGARVEARVAFVRAASALEPFDLWLDATDSLETKLWLSDAAVRRGATLVHGGALRLSGQALLVVPGEGPCLRCLLGDDGDGLSCRQAGVLGPVVGLVGAVMARLALQALRGEAAPGALVTVDARLGVLRERVLSRRRDCSTCQEVQMPIVRIPASLRSFTKNQEEVQLSGSTVGELLAALEKSAPGIGARLFDEKGGVRRYVNIFHNDEDIRFLQELKTPVKEGDKISIVPAIAGG